MSNTGGRSSGVNYATTAMFNRLLMPHNKKAINDLSVIYQADTGAGKGSLKRVKYPIYNPITNITLTFSISGLINYAYMHAPVVSMANKQPLEEIITIQPLQNQNDTDSSHMFVLTYVFYKTYPLSDPTIPVINGYGYLTCNFFQNTSVRAVFSVTNITTMLLSANLFGITIPPDISLNHTENLYMYNNNDGKQYHFILTINNDNVTISTN